MATTFRVNGREIKTKFGELALCESCKNIHQKQRSCQSRQYPVWVDGWCREFDWMCPIIPSQSKRIVAEAYAAGKEDGGMEAAREIAAEMEAEDNAKF